MMLQKTENHSTRRYSWNFKEAALSEPKLGEAEPQLVDFIFKMKYSDTKTTICKYLEKLVFV